MEPKDWLILCGLSLLVMMPVWRSGLKEELTLPQFIVNHTIWGEYPEYIPIDMISEPLSQYELNMVNNLAIAERYDNISPVNT